MSETPVKRTLAGPRRRILRALLAALIALGVAEAALRITAGLLARDVWDSFQLGSGQAIYAVGDSFTYGTGVERQEAYPAVLERLLTERGGGKAQVINNGWPGLSSANAVYAVAKIIDEADPALLLVMTGWNANDTDFARHAEAGESLSVAQRLDDALEGLRAYQMAKQALTYRQRTADLGAVELVPQAPAMDLYDFRSYQEIAREHLKQISRICRENDVPLVLLNYPYQRLPENPWQLEYEYYHLVFGRSPLQEADYLIPERAPGESGLHAVIRTTGAEIGVPVIDLHAVFTESGQVGLFQSDWHHPTAEGHRLIAGAVLDRLAPILDTDSP